MNRKQSPMNVKISLLSQHEILEPRRFKLNKNCLERLHAENSNGIPFQTIDYLAHVFLTKTRSNAAIFKFDFLDWLSAMARPNWTDYVINFTEFFRAERIIVPWNTNGHHATVYHFDSTRKVIEWFDSCGTQPDYFCTKTIKNFLKVSIKSIESFLNLIQTSL